MISEGTSVAHEKRGYSRGLILGLTMAETLLLLTFCLLIAAGAIVDRERSARETANAAWRSPPRSWRRNGPTWLPKGSGPKNCRRSSQLSSRRTATRTCGRKRSGSSSSGRRRSTLWRKPACGRERRGDRPRRAELKADLATRRR